MLPYQVEREFAGPGAFGVVAFVEHLAQLARADLALRRDCRHDAT
jgi:hypothetical protein